ncbi:hypothetical protein CHF27_008745 [Romboutsia maritimum]|uniref:Uncharacterized protein n=1 Tax=Romboutsia maritimum TaxID=2020948 RepID=A0A371IS82_9FIRM|nr:hypothetical protein [Romboutsia maritimum]RDY23325.1 hypothetical protein CHF27_008745 [Romboutsia maritimum]
MVNLIKLEIKKVLKPVIATLIITTILFLAIVINMGNYYYVQNNFEFWKVSIDYIAIIFPILVVCPTCWVMYYERKNNFLLYTFPRVSKKDYILSKWIVCILSAFLIIFIPMLIGGLVSLSFLHNIHPPASYEPPFYTNLFMPDFLINHTYLYVFIHCLWDGFLAMIVATIGFVLSLYLDNIFVILTGPFIYVILDNFTMATLGFHKQRLIASFYINCMTDTNIFNLLVGPNIALLFIIVFLIIFKFKKIKVYNL